MNNLKFLRKKNRLTQEDLAKKLGVTKMMISLYERGHVKMGPATVFDLCDIFGCSPSELLGDDMDDRYNYGFGITDKDRKEKIEFFEPPDADPIDIALHIRDSVLLQKLFALAVKSDDEALKIVIDILDILDRRKSSPATQDAQRPQVHQQ